MHINRVADAESGKMSKTKNNKISVFDRFEQQICGISSNT